MTPEEIEAEIARQVAEEAARKLFEEQNKKALPDKIPPREDIK